MRRAAAALAVAFALAGCAPDSLSFFAPAGPQAERIFTVFLIIGSVCAAIWVAVTAFWLTALARRSRAPEPRVDPETERRLGRGVVIGVAATAVILLGFLSVEFATSRSIGIVGDDPLDIEVVAHQWWWEVHYEDTLPSRRVTTANEIHVPVGRNVRLKLRSTDVIHSFWAPNLHGKTDLIPGHHNVTWFRVDEPGIYRGKCAEFCGFQHAKMNFLVIAEEPARFAAWLAQQRRPALAPTDSLRRRGQEVFLAGACVMCHTIRGTPAGGRLGPELTHLASRRTIAAGTLPNRRGYLAGWIVDAQSIKPGVRMPPNQIPAQDLDALLAYLESLR